MEKLTPEQALQNLDNATASVNANRQTHVLLQQSVIVLQTALAELARLRTQNPLE